MEGGGRGVGKIFARQSTLASMQIIQLKMLGTLLLGCDDDFIIVLKVQCYVFTLFDRFCSNIDRDQ